MDAILEIKRMSIILKRKLNGENFEECYHLAPEFNIFENIIVKVLHINTLIAEKEKSNRPKDNLDAQELKKLYQL